MDIEIQDKPFPYLEISNLYTKTENKKIFDEIKYLENKGIFEKPENTGAAVYDDEVLKENTGFFIDNLYVNREHSDILNLNRKIFNVFENNKPYNNWLFDNLSIDKDFTLVSYYENSCYYKPHRDKSLWTALTWYYEEPKYFTGGNLIFTDYDVEIECKQNYTLLFPSCIRHEVTNVSMAEKDLGKQRGRFTMTQFMLLDFSKLDY